MSRVCEICGKRPSYGHNVSHANNKTRRLWYPNLHRVKVLRNNNIVRMKICTRCIRSAKVTKAV